MNLNQNQSYGAISMRMSDSKGMQRLGIRLRDTRHMWTLKRNISSGKSIFNIDFATRDMAVLSYIISYRINRKFSCLMPAQLPLMIKILNSGGLPVFLYIPSGGFCPIISRSEGMQTKSEIQGNWRRSREKLTEQLRQKFQRVGLTLKAEIRVVKLEIGCTALAELRRPTFFAVLVHD